MSKLKLRRAKDGVMLPVRLTSKSSRYVRALLEQGRANEALERLIASWLKVPPSSVKVAQGGKLRAKQLVIEGDADQFARLVEGKLSGLAQR